MVSERLHRYVQAAYEESVVEDVMIQLLGLSDELGRPVSERIQAAAVIVAKGDLDRLADAAELARIDWRDLLVMAGLEYPDWRDRLDDLLGTEP